ncbi:MAG: PD40 domain-containing protein [Fibrobacteres bacterium]|nr:PD40 domain-containing protein [Fibrobacterota bacterium]
MAQRVAFTIALLAAAFALSAPRVSASSFNRNEAHIDWRTVETEHFRFHYAAQLEPVAGYIAGIAEGVAEAKMKRYQIRLPNKVEFIIREDIFSNGWANSLQNIMTVWITDWDFPIRSTHNWLRDVVTHEFSHLVSIQSSSKLPSPIQGLIIGYQDYYNEDVQGSGATIIPFTSQPNWFAEGVAQYESEYSGYDAWDSHRDMILRMAALHGKLLSYDRMGTFAGTSLEYEQGPYTQGFAFVKYLASRYGDSAMIRLWAENSRIHRQTLSGSMERVMGKDAQGLWLDWKNSITAQYADQVKALGPLSEGKRLTSEGFYNYYPRWDHKGENLFFVSNRGRDDFRGALYLYKLGDTTKKEDDRLKMLASVRSTFDIAPDDSTVVYHSAKNVDKDGIHKLDIYQRNVRRKEPFFSFGDDPTERRYTKDANSVDASYDKEGKRVVFVRNKLTNFQLCVANVPTASKARGKGRADVDSEDVKVLWPADSALAGRFGFQIYSPRFSPDGKAIAFSYYEGASRNIGIINADGTGFRPVLDRPYDERDPDWSPDGSALYFAADSNAIYNIYRVALARDAAGGWSAAAPEALTQVAGGAFAPAIDPSGKKLAYVNYDTTGFSLYLLQDLKPAGSPPTALRILHPKDEKIEPIEFEGKSEKYLGIPNRYILNPLLFGEEMSATDHSARRGEPKWLVGANGSIDDPVGQNEVSAALLVELGKGLDYFGANDEIISPDKESQFYLSWMNRATPVTFDLSFSRGNLASHDTVTERDRLGGAADTSVNQNYALIYRTLEAGLSYNLFEAGAVDDYSRTSFLRLAGGYTWNDFNFYDFPFAFEYYKDLYASGVLNLYSSTYSDKELVAPHGLAAAIAYTYDHAGIIRKGSFSETFEVGPSGEVLTKFRDYTLHDLDAGATYGTGLFWSDNGSVLVSAFAGSVLDWSVAKSEAGADTLDTFFAKGLFLRGYPYLRDIENLTFQGENTLKVSADLNQPILPDIYKSYWVLFVEDLYVNLFWEAGRAWNGKLWDMALFDKRAWNQEGPREAWYQTLGWGLKLNSRIYNNYPFLAYFEAATALSGVPDGKGGRQNLGTVKIPLGGRGTSIDTYATRISFGVSFGFYNGLLGKLDAARNPNRPRSALAHF